VDQAERRVSARSATLTLLFLLSACSGTGSDGEAADPALARLPYARSVVRFEPGEGAGFGAELLPGVVLGPPRGAGKQAGSLDVLSLGLGGEIVMAFGEREIVDGPGPDLVVFENAFFPSGDATQVYAEPGEVAVSEDGESFVTFACDAEGDLLAGCAGKTPTEEYDPILIDPLDPGLTGGDAFDLAELGLARAAFVRIRDRSLDGEGNTAGFDLDAVGIIHAD
jgi:hypothetical protein